MKYIVAVSGGIDSMALLHMLHTRSPHELVVAHVDHAVRADSTADEELVRSVAESYGLDYETTRLAESSDVSEDRLRAERYDYLENLKHELSADAIVTAHHADDAIETLIINLSRGTGWRGAASLRSTDTILRPLLGVAKAEIVRYAIENSLQWREDSTNDDVRYARNHIRHGLAGRLDAAERRQLLDTIDRQAELRDAIEQQVALYVSKIKTSLGYPRYDLIMLPDSVALEVLRYITAGALESEQVRRLLHFVKTGRSGAIMQPGANIRALLSARYVLL